MPEPPIVEFFIAIPGATLPARADKSAFGSLPVAAYKYCHPLTTATGYGWYIFPPMHFALQWDGTDTLWTFDGSDAWMPLAAAQFPNFQEFFDRTAPTPIKGFPPIFLADSPRRGIVQIWSGLFARTAPGWSMKIRPVANYPASKQFETFEAIVETDNWFGPLFINVRLVARNRPIVFTPDLPLFQVQPLKRECYQPEIYDSCIMHDTPLDFSSEEWSAYERTIISPNKLGAKSRGEYARRARRREKNASSGSQDSHSQDKSD